MNRFRPTTEAIKKPETQETQEDPQNVENLEETREQMASEAKKQTDQFKKKCADDLLRIENRAEKNNLIIDDEDKKSLADLGTEVEIAKEELEKEITSTEISDQKENTESKPEKANIIGVTKDPNFEGSTIVKTKDVDGRVIGYAIKQKEDGSLEGNKIMYTPDGEVGPTYQLHETDFSKLKQQGVLDSYENALTTEKSKNVDDAKLATLRMYMQGDHFAPTWNKYPEDSLVNSAQEALKNLSSADQEKMATEFFNDTKSSTVIKQPKSVAEPIRVVQKTREKIMTFFAFKQLKLREYFGKIDESQLQSLLELEFKQFKKDTPPISDIFDPEIELHTLKTLSHEQKREALAEFKDKLARQREAWATCRTFLRRKIEVNHDIEKQDLMDWIDKFSSEYGFTEPQRQTAEKIIDDYYVNRQRVKDFRQKYQDNTELLTRLTGISIKKTKKLDISVGLMAIDIHCDGYTAGRLYERSNNPVIFEGSAFSSYSNHQPPIKYNVFRIDTERKSSKPHEDQHQENSLFMQQFDQSQNESWSLWHQYKNEQDTETKRTLLESYLKAKREKALIEAKDELIAMKKPKNAGYSYNVWFKQDNSSYDYLSGIRDREDSELYRECSQRLLVKEYKRIIESAVAAFNQLKKKGRYTTDQTIALLTDKPLTQWPKTTRRLLEKDK